MICSKSSDERQREMRDEEEGGREREGKQYAQVGSGSLA